jgi:hypothetical protein
LIGTQPPEEQKDILVNVLVFLLVLLAIPTLAQTVQNSNYNLKFTPRVP